MSSKGKRSPSPGGSQNKGKTLAPALIIAPLGAEGSAQRARIKYLERQIALALRRQGFEAKLITSEGGKERITEYLIKRLTEDALAVAVLDDFNRNVMYEVAIRHALCLPTIHLIDTASDEPAPFDLKDVELIKYPKRAGGRGKAAWTNKIGARFRTMLQDRAAKQLLASRSAMFAKGLRKASAAGTLEAVFAQKRRELDILVRELRLNIQHIGDDYKPGDAIEGQRAKNHAEALYARYTHLQTANDTLLELIQNANLAKLESEQCSGICRQIAEVTEDLAKVFKALKSAGGTKNAATRRAPRPTRRSVVDALEKIIAQSLDLTRQISDLHASMSP